MATPLPARPAIAPEAVGPPRASHRIEPGAGEAVSIRGLTDDPLARHPTPEPLTGTPRAAGVGEVRLPLEAARDGVGDRRARWPSGGGGRA